MDTHAKCVNSNQVNRDGISITPVCIFLGNFLNSKIKGFDLILHSLQLYGHVFVMVWPPSHSCSCLFVPSRCFDNVCTSSGPWCFTAAHLIHTCSVLMRRALVKVKRPSVWGDESALVWQVRMNQGDGDIQFMRRYPRGDIHWRYPFSLHLCLIFFTPALQFCHIRP